MTELPRSAFHSIENAAPYSAVNVCEADFPIDAALGDGQVSIAIITGVDGPSYRPRGAAMVIDAAGQATGSLSSGCLENDLILHSLAAMADGLPRNLRYGKGSPFLDIILPCGGALDITVIPRPDRAVLSRLREQLSVREAATLVVSPCGRLCLEGPGLTVRVRPLLRLVVMGKGPEAACFATLAQQAGYRVDLYSPDCETLRIAGFGEQLISESWPKELAMDPYTAVSLFFHDHDREPPLLAAALNSPAFYVGAQGSMRAHAARREALSRGGLAPALISRLVFPYGLIPSARDPRTLAISVLAQVVDHSKAIFATIAS